VRSVIPPRRLLSPTSRRRNPRSALIVREKQIDRPLILGTSSKRMERSFPAKVTSFRVANNTWSPVHRIVRTVRNAKRVVLSRSTTVKLLKKVKRTVFRCLHNVLFLRPVFHHPNERLSHVKFILLSRCTSTKFLLREVSRCQISRFFQRKVCTLRRRSRYCNLLEGFHRNV